MMKLLKRNESKTQLAPVSHSCNVTSFTVIVTDAEHARACPQDIDWKGTGDPVEVALSLFFSSDVSVFSALSARRQSIFTVRKEVLEEGRVTAAVLQVLASTACGWTSPCAAADFRWPLCAVPQSQRSAG